MYDICITKKYMLCVHISIHFIREIRYKDYCNIYICMYLFIYSGNHVSNLNVTSVSIKQHALLSAVSVPMYLLLIKWKGEHGLGRMTYA